MAWGSDKAAVLLVFVELLVVGAQGNWKPRWRETRTKQLLCCLLDFRREGEWGRGRTRPTKTKVLQKTTNNSISEGEVANYIAKTTTNDTNFEGKGPTTLAKNSQQHYYCEIMTLDTNVAKKTMTSRTSLARQNNDSSLLQSLVKYLYTLTPSPFISLTPTNAWSVAHQPST